MHFASTVILDPDFFPDRSHNSRVMLNAADIAVRAYVSDVKVLVETGVNLAIKDDLQSPDPAVLAAAKDRLRALKKWKLSSKPLSYSEDAYVPLIRAVVDSTAPIRLPVVSGGPTSLIEVATALVKSANDGIRTVAPICSGGTSLAVLKAASLYIAQRSGFTDPKGISNFVINLIKEVLYFQQIAHVPWSRPKVPTDARSSHKASFNFWRATGRVVQGSSSMSAALTTPRERNELDLLEHAASASRNNTMATWNILDLTVSQYGPYTVKTIRPSEWSLTEARLSDSRHPVPAIYRWVDSKWEGTALLNRFAIMLSGLWTKCSPYYSHGPLPQRLSGKDVSPNILAESIRNEPWIKTKIKRNGLADSLPPITMLSAYIVALYTPDSPLRTYMTLNNSLSAPWSEKHGTYPFSLSNSFLSF